MRRDGTFQGTTPATDPSYQGDLEEFDAGIDDCMQVCQSESSRTAYMRTWRLWAAFNVLNLGLYLVEIDIADPHPGAAQRSLGRGDGCREH